jgi:hypothetical protein
MLVESQAKSIEWSCVIIIPSNNALVVVVVVVVVGHNINSFVVQMDGNQYQTSSAPLFPVDCLKSRP